VLLEGPDGALAAYTGRQEPAMGLFALLAEQETSEGVRELGLGSERYVIVSAEMPGGARAFFVRALSEELAVVPTLRSAGARIIGLALVMALLVGVWFASRMARPVGSLAAAASRIREGAFDEPIEHSALVEVEEVNRAFEVMRDALALRIEELGAANRELEDRQERLGILQAELVQRDRLSAASRLLAQLAHEVRNPVASVRNCLEILRRRVDGDDEASVLADLAIYELLRMHELARRVVLSRPNLSRLADRLEKAGLLERRDSAEDGRGYDLVLTKQGRAMRKRMWPVYEGEIGRLFASHVSEAEARSLAEALARAVKAAR